MNYAIPFSKVMTFFLISVENKQPREFLTYLPPLSKTPPEVLTFPPNKDEVNKCPESKGARIR